MNCSAAGWRLGILSFKTLLKPFTQIDSIEESPELFKEYGKR